MNNEGLWINDSDINNYYYTLAAVSTCFIIIFILIKFGLKEFFKNRPRLKNYLLYITCSFVCLWLWAYFIAYYGYPGVDTLDNPYAQSQNNFHLGFYTLAIPVIGILGLLMLCRRFELITWSRKESGYISFLTLIFGYVFLFSIYFINYSIQEGNGFPLENVHFGSEGVNGQTKEAMLGTFYGLLATTIILGISAAVLRNGGVTTYEPETIKNTIKAFAVSFVITILFGIITAIINLIPNNVNGQTIYTGWLIASNFLILGLLLIALAIILFNNYIRQENESFLNAITLGCALTALILSITNSALSANQKVLNTTNFNGAKTKDGKDLQNHNESSYDLLNFGMTYNYISLCLISTLLLFYSAITMMKKDEIIKKLSSFFVFDSKILEYNWWSLLLLVAVVGICILSIYLGIVVGENKNFGNINSEGIDGEGPLPSIVVSGFLILIYVIERIYNNSFLKEDEKQSTFVLKFFQLLIMVAFMFFPIISLVIYFTNIPKFYSKLSNDNDEILVFGDIKNHNGIPNIDGDETDNNSKFSVASNFSYYGNGLFFSGGRTNLDLDTTRGIRYVSNQADYFNFKYLYQDLDFKDIAIEEDLNIFSLETNDLSYGAKINSGDSYWVVVGQNVGLTDSSNSTIYYNTTAGASNNQEIPDVSDLSQWFKASSGAFSYSGNGVVSGLSGSDNRWVAVGQDSVDYPSTNFNTIKYSDDGKIWNNATGTSFSGYGNKVSFAISSLKTDNTYVAVGYDIGGNNILKSTDGVNWITTTNNFNREGSDVAYGVSSNGTSGLWVAVGQDDNYPIKYSVNDGSTWINSDETTYSFSKPDDVNAVTYDLKNKRFYVAGKKGTTQSVYYSSNGLSWTPASGYDFDESTSLAYNLESDFTDYNDVYYPPRNYQQFFVDKIENKSLTEYLLIVYVITFILILITFYAMYKTSKDYLVKLV